MKNLPRDIPRTPQDFGDFLWSSYPKGYVTVASRLTDSTKGFHHTWSTVSASYSLMSDAASLSLYRDVYFPVASYKSRERSREGVQALKWVWADLDDHALADEVPQPTLLMQTSSGRYQALWYLKDSPSIDAIEERVRAIAASCGLNNATVSANQILRIPGTINHKPERNNYLVRVEDYRHEAIYRLDDFAHLAPGPVPLGRAESLDLIASEEASLLWHEAYYKLSPRLKRLAYGQDVLRPDGKPYPSQSEADMALITAFVRKGYSAAQAGALFLVSPRSSRSFKKHGMTETMQRARKYAASAEKLVALPSLPIEIPHAIFTASLDPTAIAIYATYSEYSFGNKRPFLAQEKIADLLSLDPKTVHSAVERLVEKGFLIPEGKVQRANRYRLSGDAEMVKVPLPLLHTVRERSGADGLALSAAIMAGYTNQDSLARAFGMSRQRAARKIRQLVEHGVITITTGPRGLQQYGLSSDVSNTGTMYWGGKREGRNEET